LYVDFRSVGLVVICPFQ